MRILIASRFFYPSLGGSETDADILAREFVKLGCQVKLITQTPGGQIDANGDQFPFEVIRQPKPLQLLKAFSWCDVCLQNGIILKQLWAFLLTQKPWVIRHQTWIRQPGQPPSPIRSLKLLITKFATSISISREIEKHLDHPSFLIPNPYRDELFRILPNTPRTKELVFLGRLVSDKGVDLLLRSVANLRAFDLQPKLTIIGSGADASLLRQLMVNLDLENQVTFVGPKVGNELVQLLNEHHILVAPSRWHEPLGVVALEGIACGCVVVGSSGGGLKDAIGACGETFPNGDETALTKILARLLSQPGCLAQYRASAFEHLGCHKKSTVAEAYLNVLRGAVS